MKKIYTNLKRFDVPKNMGGVNSLTDIKDWAETIVKKVEENIRFIDAEFTTFFPEAHLINAIKAKNGKLNIGCQGVYREDISKGGNFGAFTTKLPATAAYAIGVNDVIIGHCEERKALEYFYDKDEKNEINKVLNDEIKCATDNNMRVLYCVGEKDYEMDSFKEVLKEQIETGINNIPREFITIAYEPVWAIGPGKNPPDKEYITKIASYIKEITNGLDVVYGGGLKKENAKMLSEIEEIDGGLIALTRFSGDIGFYPDEYLEIVKIYLGLEE